MELIAIIAIVIALGTYLSARNTKKRREALMAKYGDAALVQRIMNRQFWQGQTTDQLLDSLGRPVEVDEKVLKTKTKLVWKYKQTGKNRFALRITLENGQVVGWDQR
ncbi:DUF2845 domain-containing protein [Roseateles noduli]|uniref:DUF2845 domain-containing protein n=1 Tax=Roseateles noduli TaxID=2052484 RepID=UPI003D65E946